MSDNTSNNPQRYFSIDYRSCPSGIGTIIEPDGQTLVTSPDTGPESIEEALDMFGPLYKFVIYIDKSFGEDNESAHRDLQKVLTKSNIQYVHDSELAFEYPEKNTNGFFKTNTWTSIINNMIN